MFDLSGKTALVTGAGQNMGAGVARTLAGQGAHVLVNDLLAERADEVAADITAAGGSAAGVAFDVTDLDAVTAAIEANGPVDIVINNAGNGGAEGMVPTQFKDMDPAEWDSPIQVNLRGVMNTSYAVINGMVDRGWGRIITISSGAGNAGVGIGVAPYSAGKGGGLGFTRSLALEVASTGVTCNSVALGLMNNVGTSDVTAHLAKGVPAKRLGSPEDVGAMCVYLASPEASWVTAQTYNLNGGSITS
ncbi:MAG: SDR family NAD(P)-dependent oxidoreductase [Acidimicrobiales bacterium]|jgi:3-oxoacyl-[acyl-carrier protein] reductase|nr:SDR family NAD(P)-dependent oxidoreductase [Acidimicrobiales bacterium]